jgi:hypothetical protein
MIRGSVHCDRCNARIKVLPRAAVYRQEPSILTASSPSLSLLSRTDADADGVDAVLHHLCDNCRAIVRDLLTQIFSPSDTAGEARSADPDTSPDDDADDEGSAAADP